MIQYEIFDEHINQLLLWKIAWLRLRCSIKLKSSGVVYIVTAKGFGNDKLIVESSNGSTFSVKISDIERINVSAGARG